MTAADRLERWGMMLDIFFAARAVGFRGLSPSVWAWSERASISDVAKERAYRWELMRKYQKGSGGLYGLPVSDIK